MSFPSSAWECVPRSSASHSRSRNRLQNKQQQRPNHRHVSFPSSERVKQSPTPLTPRVAAPAAACVAGRSRGQHMLPQQAFKTNSNSAPIKPMSFPSSAWECVPRSSASHSRSRNRLQNKRQQRPNHRHVSFPSSERVKESPTPLTPRAAAPAAACVAGRSRGQHMLPQQPSKQTATAPPLNLCRSQAPLGNASREAPLRTPAPAIAPRTNTAPAARRAGLPIGIPGGFFHTLSSGGARRWENQEV